MNASVPPSPRFDSGPGRVLMRAAQVLALGGAAILLLLAVTSAVSIAGRWMLARPLPGDYELAQLATAIAVASFLPYCALRSGHVLVDFVTSRASMRLKAGLDAFGSLAVAAVGALITWRMALGFADMRAAGETTMVLGIPQWIAYGPMLASFALLALCGLFMTWHHVDVMRSRWAR